MPYRLMQACLAYLTFHPNIFALLMRCSGCRLTRGIQGRGPRRWRTCWCHWPCCCVTELESWSKEHQAGLCNHMYGALKDSRPWFSSNRVISRPDHKL